jgi:FkbM family methyltransferase
MEDSKMRFSWSGDNIKIKSRFKYLLFLLLTRVADFLNDKFDFSKLPYALEIYSFICTKLQTRIPGVINTNYGFKMYINPGNITGGFSLALKGIFEQEETELFRKIVKEGDVVVDVGANIGYYTLLASKLVGKEGRVYAFEPEPENYSFLLKNLKINNVSNVIALQKAVSNKGGTVKLYLCEHNPGGHSIVFARKRFIQVESLTLDEFFKENPKVDVVKLDIEGGEMLALLGMKSIINRNASIKIFMEFWPRAFKMSGYSPEDLINYLLACRLKIVDLRDKKAVHSYKDLKSVKKATTLFAYRI